MSQLTFADLIATPVPLSPAEAVALTLAVAEALTESGSSGVPPDDQIVLSSTGQVTLLSVAGMNGGFAAPHLAALTRRLLQLDKARSVDRRKCVPAPLLAVLVRGMGQADSASATPIADDEFRRALEQFATPDATSLAAVFWRAARLHTPQRPHPVPLPPSKLESSSAARSTDDRRKNVPPPSELRRYLREAERELFEARAHAQIPATPSRLPVYRRRMWRAGAGIAAVLVSAILGTVVTFTLARSSNTSERIAAASTDLHTEHVTDAVPAASGSDSELPIRTERTVQPLLLAAAVGADVFSPSFAPRGRTILFHAGREAAPLMRASLTDSGEVDRIETLVDDGAANYHVTMSPDGNRIAYDSDRDGVRGVYVARADGSAPRRISGSGYGAVPSWSPDGEHLAFVRAEPQHPRVWNVWIADLRSGRLRRVTNHSSGQPWGASWFPDGRRLAYSLEDRLMVADLETGLGRGYLSPRAGQLVRTPAVSPDGTRIVFQVQRDGVWLLDLEQARMRRILADETAEEFVWMPDGDAIAYHARKSGSYGLWRLALRQ